MTKTITTYLLQLTFLSCVIALALSINYISAATWVGPTAAPPGSNTAAPLNVGTTNQVKDANLSVGHSTNIATDYGLVSYGRVRSTIGGFEFPDGSVQVSAAASVNSAYTVYADTASMGYTNPSQFNRTYSTKLSSRGDIWFSQTVNLSTLFEMKLNATAATTLVQYLKLVDDNAYFFLNGVQIDSSGNSTPNRNITWNLVPGLNTIDIVLNNTGNGPTTLYLFGDLLSQSSKVTFAP